MKTSAFLVGTCLAVMTSALAAHGSSLSDPESDHPLTIVTYTAPGLSVATFEQASLGIFDAPSIYGAGNRMVNEHSIDDPALAVSSNMASAVAARLRSSNTIFVHDAGDDSIAELSEAAHHKGNVFDVETITWRLGYFPLDGNHYRVQYFARARLIDVAAGRLIATSDCAYTSDNDRPSLTYDDLLANDAALLKQKLSAAVVTCTETFSRELLTPKLPIVAQRD